MFFCRDCRDCRDLRDCGDCGDCCDLRDCGDCGDCRDFFVVTAFADGGVMVTMHCFRGVREAEQVVATICNWWKNQYCSE